jgi:hypothetical protein
MPADVGDWADGGGSFLLPGSPYLTHIDGLPIEKWIETIQPVVVNGSVQWRRVRSVVQLPRQIDFFRRMMKLEAKPGSVDLTLESGGRYNLPPALRRRYDGPSGWRPLRPTTRRTVPLVKHGSVAAGQCLAVRILNLYEKTGLSLSGYKTKYRPLGRWSS